MAHEIRFLLVWEAPKKGPKGARNSNVPESSRPAKNLGPEDVFAPIATYNGTNSYHNTKGPSKVLRWGTSMAIALTLTANNAAAATDLVAAEEAAALARLIAIQRLYASSVAGQANERSIRLRGTCSLTPAQVQATMGSKVVIMKKAWRIPLIDKIVQRKTGVVDFFSVIEMKTSQARRMIYRFFRLSRKDRGSSELNILVDRHGAEVDSPICLFTGRSKGCRRAVKRPTPASQGSDKGASQEHLVKQAVRIGQSAGGQSKSAG